MYHDVHLLYLPVDRPIIIGGRGRRRAPIPAFFPSIPLRYHASYYSIAIGRLRSGAHSLPYSTPRKLHGIRHALLNLHDETLGRTLVGNNLLSHRCNNIGNQRRGHGLHRSRCNIITRRDIFLVH